MLRRQLAGGSLQTMQMEVRMTDSTKYSLTAIVCALIASLILGGAYMIINRYDHTGPDGVILVDNWTGS